MADSCDHQYMAHALRLAARGLYTTDPNPRVGCVLVRHGEIVGEGWHERAGQPHAEIHALGMAGERARGATAYITLEPCCHHGRTPPCTDALLAAGVARVVAAMEDPNPQVGGQGLAQLRAAGVAVECGVLEAQARALNPGFISRMARGRPWVRVKLAMSLDGRTALGNGDSRWITSEEARTDVQRLRARAGAILTGVNTVLVDDPALNVRLPGVQRQPLRVILDSRLRTPPAARTLRLPGQVLILTAEADERRWQPLLAAGAQVARVDAADGGLDLAQVLTLLARREVNELHVECGSILAGALLSAGLLDELVVYLAPLLLGHAGRGLFHLPAIERMEQRRLLVIDGLRPVGRDWRITARPQVVETP
ncbi:MAG TPA: bifunctional diaminohydroxyphosphoribosylaminopyrimidine deaminase/5-amino-6-(5-phosphoribosylamino)uracil reductase RibD [Candidatus Competibacteraceae bacterium]|nr:bifunctional diaminohydroxyphosphoribosylaminopyrimidine deaminase/5-amino-6-(5-phosphoribosylamino)uracil reductase RibD [Candidatus Competibacteraceae bacterium]